MPVQRAPREILSEQARAFDAALIYDIFLTHSFDDADAIYGLKRMIKVYFSRRSIQGTFDTRGHLFPNSQATAAKKLQ